MRTTSLLISSLTLLLATGCGDPPASADQACPDFIFGAGNARTEVRDAMTKINCYRRYAGSQKTNINADIVGAMDAHSQYLSLNWDTIVEQNLSIHTEVSGNPGFTGVDMFTRLEAQGWTIPQQDHHVFTLVDVKESADMPSWALIDRYVHEPYFRQILMQPGVLDAGYGEFEEFVGLTMVSEWPASTPLGRAIVWPVDGQTNVPPSYYTGSFNTVDGERYDNLDPWKLYGYPITVTLGADTSNGTPLDDPNSLSLAVLSHTLTGPDGVENTTVVTPDSTQLPLPSSVMVVPDSPLQENAQYTLEIAVSVVGREIDATTTFTTGSYE